MESLSLSISQATCTKASAISKVGRGSQMERPTLFFKQKEGKTQSKGCVERAVEFISKDPEVLVH